MIIEIKVEGKRGRGEGEIFFLVEEKKKERKDDDNWGRKS